MTKMPRVSFLPPKAPGGACPAGGSRERAASVPVAGVGGCPCLGLRSPAKNVGPNPILQVCFNAS